MRQILKIISFLLLAVTLLSLSFLAFISFTDYKPKNIEVVFEKQDTTPIREGAQLSLLTWNIGYCGMNKDMDFFYEGGTQVYPTKEIIADNIQGILQELKKHSAIDFFFFQEVDIDSQRSQFTDQIDILSNALPNYHATFTKNYVVPFVPVPITKPMGKVHSGLLNFGKHIPNKSTRYAYKKNYTWPKSLFLPDRGFLVNRYTIESKAELVLINIHNTAYDTGELRLSQINRLKEFAVNEYTKGNYIIIGGDWNQQPPNFKANFNNEIVRTKNTLRIESNFMPKDWTWLYDNTIPSNRRNEIVYTKGETPTTVIDFFLLSPNIKALSIENIPMDFAFSDHQPVVSRIKLLSTKD